MPKAKNWSDFDKTDAAAHSHKHVFDGLLILGRMVSANEVLPTDANRWLIKLHRPHIKALADWFAGVVEKNITVMFGKTQASLSAEAKHRRSRKINAKIKRCSNFLAITRYWSLARSVETEAWRYLVDKVFSAVYSLAKKLNEFGSKKVSLNFLDVALTIEPMTAKTIKRRRLPAGGTV